MLSWIFEMNEIVASIDSCIKTFQQIHVVMDIWNEWNSS